MNDLNKVNKITKNVLPTGYVSKNTIYEVPFIGWVFILSLVFAGISLSTLHIMDRIYPPADGSAFPEFVWRYLYGDEFFAHVLGLWAYPLQLWFHVVFGIGYLLLAPLQFVSSLRRNFPYLHRTIGWLSVVMSMVLNLGGLVIVANASYVGLAEQITIFFVAFSYMSMLYMALKNIRAGNIAKHREWMILAFALMLAVIAVRPCYVALLTAGYPSKQIFVVAMWLATATNMTIAATWIKLSRAPLGSALQNA